MTAAQEPGFVPDPPRPPADTKPGDRIVTRIGPPQTPPSWDIPQPRVVGAGDPANIPPQSRPGPFRSPVDGVLREPEERHHVR